MGTNLIKICGIQDLETLTLCSDLRVDFVGLNFSHMSPRRIDLPTAKMLCESSKAFAFKPKIVFLFFQNSITDIEQILNELSPDFIQFIEGDVDSETIQFFQSNATLLPAIRVQKPVTELPFPECPLLILDSYDKGTGGGSGKTFPWDFVKTVTRPFLLAGGINPENVQLALRELNPKGIDVASGVETNKKKDPEKIRALVNNVRNL